MTQQHKRAALPSAGNLGPLCLLFFVLLFLAAPKEMQAQNITHIYTDYLGFWSSGVGNISTIKPDYSHNLLGYTFNGVTYSTGVGDAILTSYGVEFEAMNYQALPVVDLEISSGGSRFVMFGEMQDGIHNGVQQGTIPFPYSLPVSLYDVMTDGKQGLDISTGVTNMKNSDGSLVEMVFPTAIENIEQIADGIPDILITQTASPNSVIDEIWFTDSDGNRVGNSIEIIQTSLPDLGKTMNDFFDPKDAKVGSGFINSERGMKISAYDVSEFGISTANYPQAQRLVYKMGGSSDPAFVAFNTELIKILVANNDMAQTNIDTPVEIDVLENDHMPVLENLEVSVEEAPTSGRVEIDPETHMVTYFPDAGFTGVDNFMYKISDSESSDVAMVSVVVGAADIEVTKEMSNETPATGEQLTFTIGVKNNGPFEALVVRVNDLLPAGYTYISHSVSAGSYSPLTGVWFVGSLQPSPEAGTNAARLNMEVRVNDSGPYTNTAVGESVNYDPNLDNNEASVTPGSLPSATLTVGCTSGFEHQQVNIVLTGEGPWELVYSFEGGEDVILSDINTSSLTIDMEASGRFYLKSVEDRYENKVAYAISPESRVLVNPCYVVSNPMMRSRAKKI